MVFNLRSAGFRASAVVLALFLVPALAAAQTIRPCLTPDSTSASVVRLGVTLVSDTSARVAGLRSKYGIPSGTASDEVVIQDNAVCETLTAAMDSVATPSQQAYHVVGLSTSTPLYLLAKAESSGLTDGIFLLNAQGSLLAVFH